MARQYDKCPKCGHHTLFQVYIDTQPVNLYACANCSQGMSTTFVQEYLKQNIQRVS